MKRKFKASYDEDGDVLTVYRDAPIRESIEVTEDLIIDVDREMQLVNLEFMDAYKFLNSLNKSISKKMLLSINELELDAKRVGRYWVITLLFKYKDKVIAEKLPAFASSDFKSPLLASASV